MISEYCVKCGHDDGSFKYVGDIVDKISVMKGITVFVNKSEYQQLLITCNRCGYIWVEDCVDEK